MEEKEELTSSCENSEPPLHNAPDTSTEDTSNDHGAVLTEGENCHNMLNFSFDHAITCSSSGFVLVERRFIFVT
jgi:hypothetical protein